MLRKDCMTCTFHCYSEDGLSLCWFHGDTTRKHREGKNCGDWDMSFEYWIELMGKD